MKVFFVGLMAVVLSAGLITAQQPGISVYVALPVREGFVDAGKEILDSYKDLREQLKYRKYSRHPFRLVDTPEQAQLVLTVIGRGKGAFAYGQMATMLTPNTVLAGPMVANNYWILTTLTVGPYVRELRCEVSDVWRHSPWKDCARQMIGELKAWVDANAAQLQQL